MRVLQDVTGPFAGHLVIGQMLNPAISDVLHVSALSGVGVPVQVEAVRFAFLKPFQMHHGTFWLLYSDSACAKDPGSVSTSSMPALIEEMFS
mgnify:CR=1 FL=1